MILWWNIWGTRTHVQWDWLNKGLCAIQPANQAPPCERPRRSSTPHKSLCALRQDSSREDMLYYKVVAFWIHNSSFPAYLTQKEAQFLLVIIELFSLQKWRLYRLPVLRCYSYSNHHMIYCIWYTYHIVLCVRCMYCVYVMHALSMYYICIIYALVILVLCMYYTPSWYDLRCCEDVKQQTNKTNIIYTLYM